MAALDTSRWAWLSSSDIIFLSFFFDTIFLEDALTLSPAEQWGLSTVHQAPTASALSLLQLLPSSAGPHLHSTSLLPRGMASGSPLGNGLSVCLSSVCSLRIPCAANEPHKGPFSLLSVLSPSVGPSRLLCPWHFPGKNPGVGCHVLFHLSRFKLHSILGV